MSVIEENFKDQKHYLKIGNYTDSLSDFNMADNANNDNLRDSYRKKIEPWLSAILQSDHFVVV